MLQRAKYSIALLLCACGATPPFDAHVGPAADGSTIVTTGQRVRPVGDVLRFAGRPVDLVLSPDGRSAFVKEIDALMLVDVATWSVVQRLPFGDEHGASMHGIAVSHDGSSVFVTDTKHALREARVVTGGKLEWQRSIDLPLPAIKGEPYPCGLALSADEKLAFVCLSRSNSVAVVDLVHEMVMTEIAVGVSPFDVVLSPDGTVAYVSNFGGRRTHKGDTSARSAGTDIVVDARGIGASGTVSKIDVAKQTVTASIEVGLHPSDLELTRDGRRLFVAAANSDAVFAIDTAAFTVAEKIDVRPDAKLPFGSVVNALALSPDETHLYAANGGNNALAVVRLGRDGHGSTLEGYMPTDWFPGAIACRGQEIFVASVRGDGSRDARAEHEKDGRWHSGWWRGSIAHVKEPDRATLATWTKQARDDARVPEALLALDRARSGIAPVPVPRRVGEPSVFEHVVYVIKENRTYDQVLGDMPRGNNDPNLCIFGRDVTPNHHSIAEHFALLDNYYCNGVLSTEGHQWATQGTSTDYREKQFGGWTRSYDFGTDALSYASSDFLWDEVLLAGRSFRNYGEFDFPNVHTPHNDWPAIYQDWKSGANKFDFTQSVQLESLRRYTAPRYPGWDLKIPDQVRVDRFLEEFREAERTGEWPNLVIVYLPEDHTSGTSAKCPTPRAHVADNDLALGRLVEAISKSRFWPKTCIFVNEDDPQNGFDHVDGHRSLCLVASPYTKRGAVVSSFYDQTSVLHTIERILGVGPMTQIDASAPTMEACFMANADLTPYAAVANKIPLDELNPDTKKAQLDAETQRFAALSEATDLSRPDQIDEDAWNRALWFAAKGASATYPVEFAGAHGRGLGALALKLDPDVRDDDDDDD